MIRSQVTDWFLLLGSLESSVYGILHSESCKLVPKAFRHQGDVRPSHMQPDTACPSPQGAPQVHGFSLVPLQCCTALEGVSGSSYVRISSHSVVLCPGDPIPTASFQRRAELTAW